MTKMHLAEQGTGICHGIYHGVMAPTGTIDTETPCDDSRKVWDGSAWVLSDEHIAADERNWRNGQLLATDVYGLSDMVMTGDMTAFRQSLRDMPAQAGFPNSHARPKLT